ncbi:MAG: DUF5926 family protein [Winkia neuii]|uniref:DUF5926 domain-containing protein n=1 Tax=Winkia neuii TaxID=33007 RepID=A0A2I1IQL9_9ACTO|nr:DUF5926 family protein [Winkia neuii]MDK8100528.1 DUF5926 family protein [Winkia neuii]MDU3133979.1 DUF5926 family protein [Winkia neuii]OFJ72026.1 hypothetical protein HMPREF2851_05765 [Actinomyces sp. HMSC064C12]PKY73417.1 hypothetical protein CYJ19_02200 [Winkia neuii]
MSKKSRRKAKYAARRAQIDALVAENEKKAPKKETFTVEFNERPFAGFAREIELVAMREILPAATLQVTVSGKPVTLCTMLPRNAQALIHDDGTIKVALNTRNRSGDPAHDLALVLDRALKAKPGTTIEGLDPRTEAPALTELLDPAEMGTFTLHNNFEFWLDEATERTPEVERAIEESADSIVQMGEVAGHRGAYWADMTHPFLRWVLSEDEEDVLNALARLRAAGKLNVGEGSDFIGAFRACGLVAPVFQLSDEAEIEHLSADLAEPLAQLTEGLQAALKETTPLTDAERRAKAGIVSRQVSLR